VFVVDHWIDHDRANYRKVLVGAISQEYKEVTISPWYQEPLVENTSCAPTGSNETWRLYFGATYDKPLHGMYSFFPCLTDEPKSKGFARPRISLLGLVTGNLNQGKTDRAAKFGRNEVALGQSSGAGRKAKIGFRCVRRNA